MNEGKKSPEQTAREYTDNFRNDKVRNYYQNVQNIKTLEDSDRMNELIAALNNLTRKIAKDDSKSDSRDPKLLDKLGNVNELLKAFGDQVEDGTNDWKSASKTVNKVLDTLLKDQSKYSKETNAELANILDKFGDIADAAETVNEGLKKHSATLRQQTDESLKTLGQGIMKFSNFLNLNKLATGGKGVSELRDIQHAVKVDLGINQDEFMRLQGSLIETNREIGSELGLSFKDSINYLSQIKDYNFKNYNQAKAMYTQISLGTKYLGITTSNMDSLVKATNALADDSYMNRQLAIMATLSNDSAVTENMNDIAQFMGANSTNAAARYGNFQDVLQGAAGIKSVSDALFGNESKLIEGLMSEIMGASDYSQLSQSTQTLLAYTGQTQNVWSQMRSGNLDFNTIIPAMLQTLGNKSQNQYQRTTMESLGLGNWATLGGDYNNNSKEFLELLQHQNALLEGIDLTTEEGQKQWQEMLANGKDDRTFFEKMEDGLFNFLGIQNQNWTAVLGIIQTLQFIATGIATYSTIRQSTLLHAILTAITTKNATEALTGFENKSLFSQILGGGGATKVGKVAGAGLALAGLSMGISDAQKTMNYSDNKAVGALRGFFLGTGSTNQTTEENAVSVLGNTGKWAMAGAGIGMMVGHPVIGALIGGTVGLIAGLFGASMDANTEAVRENTDVLGESNDSIVKNSALLYKYQEYVNGRTGSAPITMGSSSGSTSNFGVGDAYPWRVTSPYAMRWGKHHDGIDFGIPIGTKIGMPVSGIVTRTQNDPRNTWATKDASAGTGAYILGDNGIKYVFWHLSQLAVQNGQRVSAGQLVGLSGNTGYSSGPHLHFGTFSGSSAVDPAGYINNHLFSPGEVAAYDASNVPTSASDEYSTITNGKSLYLSKDSSFAPAVSFTSGASGSGDVEPTTNNYATSADIDRLIEAMTTLNQNQNDQRQFLQALAGKNTFVLH